MSYVRIYPSKNNSLFINHTGEKILKEGNVNTGLNPILELRDGNSTSILTFQFDLTSIKSKLSTGNFKCNLKLWDAGNVEEPLLKDLKPINVYYFENDFVEGDGWSFASNKAKTGVSNWNKRDVNNNWTTEFNTPFTTYQLQQVDNDILITSLETQIETSLTNNTNPNFGLRLENNTPSTEIYKKFIYSRQTRTIYKPYLEFYIDDVVQDDRENVYVSIPTKLHLINLKKQDFIGSVTCKIINVDKSIIEEPVVINNGEGVYSITFTPSSSLLWKNVYDTWYIDDKLVKKNIINIKSSNIVSLEDDFSNLYFYPATYYQHPIVRKGDKVIFSVISESRNKGSYLLPNYEFKVVCTNGFEMQPWQPVSLYDNKLFCYLDTQHYFEELEYEVFVRLKLNDRVQTSPQTFKFRLVYDGPTRMTNISASPYDSRDIYLRTNSSI